MKALILNEPTEGQRLEGWPRVRPRLWPSLRDGRPKRAASSGWGLHFFGRPKSATRCPQ